MFGGMIPGVGKFKPIIDKSLSIVVMDGLRNRRSKGKTSMGMSKEGISTNLRYGYVKTSSDVKSRVPELQLKYVLIRQFKSFLICFYNILYNLHIL
jgi:hypothetical protein